MKDSYKFAIANLSLMLTALILIPILNGMVLASAIALIILSVTLNSLSAVKQQRELFGNKISDSQSLPGRVFKTAPSGIFIINEKGIIIDLNLKAESWFYGTKDKICGKSLFRNIDFDPKKGRHFKTVFFNDLATHFPAEIHVKPIYMPEESLFVVYVDDITEVVREQDKLLRLANEDTLTGLLNRRSFLNELNKEIERSSRTGLSCTLVLIDLDHFKDINDTYGHDFGDEVLKTFSRILKDKGRQLDILCRYGGEEFVALLPHTAPVDSLHYLERVRTEFAGYSYSYNIQPTFSCGVVAGNLGGDDSDVDRLLKKADDLLYKAKEKGRNRIECSDIDKGGIELICVS